MADDKTEAHELLDYVLKQSFRKFFFEVVDGNNLKIIVEREAIEKYVVEKLSAIRIAAESAQAAKYRACVEALRDAQEDLAESGIVSTCTRSKIDAALAGMEG